MIRGDGPSSVEKDSNLDPLVRLWYAATLFNHQSTLENPWTALLHLFWLEFCIRPRWVVEGWVACYSCTGRAMQRLKKTLYGLEEEGWASSLSISFPETSFILDILSTLFLGGLNSKSCWVLDPKIKKNFCLLIDALFFCRFHPS